MTISGGEAGKTCPYCRFPLKDGQSGVRCSGCGTVHHADCWQEGGGCAVLGCVNAGAGAAAQPAWPSAPARPSQPPVAGGYGYGPPARSSTASRNLLIGLAAGLAVAAVGVGAFFALHHGSPTPVSSGQTDQGSTQQPTTSSSNTQSPTTPVVSVDERLSRRLEQIVLYSEHGRLDVQSGRYNAALANRQQTLLRLQQLVGGSPQIRQAIRTFKTAIHWSLQSDEAYASGSNASYPDSQSTKYKRLFVTEFNPIARRYGLTTFDADSI